MILNFMNANFSYVSGILIMTIKCKNAMCNMWVNKNTHFNQKHIGGKNYIN